MSIFVFVAVIIVSYFMVRIGASAFELTGLDPEQAHFQSLSAFTGTGFTTRESEQIMIHKQRRKIASVMMIFGNAGLVTLIATLVNSIRPDGSSIMVLPVIKQNIPSVFLPYLNLTIVLCVLFIVYRIFHSSKFASVLMDKVQQKMVDKKFIQRACFEELLLNAEGYGVSQVEVTEQNPLLGKTLSESRLREHDILLLSVSRDGENIINPAANIKFKTDDKLVCFGKLDNIRKMAYEES
ncbi:cation:proton antiporter regulatory subunit [Candidatus Omnitrophota bacterium]